MAFDSDSEQIGTPPSARRRKGGWLDAFRAFADCRQSYLFDGDTATQSRGPAPPTPAPQVAGTQKPPSPTVAAAGRGRRRRWALGALLTLLAALALEAHTSWLQAWTFSRIAQKATFQLGSGPSPHLRFPAKGPYDRRLGYDRLPHFLERLGLAHYAVDVQARMSANLLWEMDRGLFPSYREKPQAGLRILDHSGLTLFANPYPRRIYQGTASMPTLVAQTLLFIENRELLDLSHPYRNPVVEWDRLAQAVLERARQWVDPGAGGGAGGSTLATQMEKFRHSPDGLTRSPADKLRQMVSASLRTYRDGPDTRDQRPQILVDYLNALPLGAVPGFGEVTGLGDGLWAWYGADFTWSNELLASLNGATNPSPEAVTAYREVLSLLLAQRRPSYFLGPGREDLERLTDSYLRILAREGVIGPALRDGALDARPPLVARADVADPEFKAAPKAVNTVRVPLLALLGTDSLYDLDRLDLEVTSTLDRGAQRAVTGTLQRLSDRPFARQAGVLGHHLLGSEDLSKVIYSVTLYQRGRDYHRLRVQTDSLDEPFDVNDGLKLDLGSTAKLRTYVHYLEIIAQLHQRYGALSAHALGQVQVAPQDHLTRFVVDYLARSKDRSLTALLEAAKARRYSASPNESFFTGGGAHNFSNFDKADNDRVLSVQDALRQSVNLVFIRLMRDIVRYHIYQRDSVSELLKNPDDPERAEYLARFADLEGSQFLRRFYAQYQHADGDALAQLLERVHPIPSRLAAAFRYVQPEATPEAFADALRARLGDSRLSPEKLRTLYDRYAPDHYNLADRGYIAQVHPLELWLAAYLTRHPQASLRACLKASREARQDAYRWLLRGGHKRAQDRRIRSLLEMEAFADIHQAWQRLGYPFDYLVPSYATAIGSSGDRPAALAELMGILLDNGMRRQLVRVERLDFAQDTPYETRLRRAPGESAQVLAPEVAAAVREGLYQVVENGTALRLSDPLIGPTGQRLRIGGKTGTGDHRQQTYGPGGQVRESRVMNRAATFVFIMGDQYFGVVTAYVPGPDAAHYDFTSSLATQVLKVLEPDLVEMMARTGSEPARGLVACNQSASDCQG